MYLFSCRCNTPFGVYPGWNRALYFGAVLRALLFFLCCLPASLFAQPLNLPVQSFTADQGLGGATIISLAQDPRGFLWIGTPDDLLLYDGVQFRPFRYSGSHRSPASFRRAVVLSLDTLGFLLLHEDGAHQYAFHTGILRAVTTPFSHNTALLLQSFTADSTLPGRYRFISSNACSFYLPATGEWQHTQTFKTLRAALRAGDPGKEAQFLQPVADTTKTLLLNAFTRLPADSFEWAGALAGGGRFFCRRCNLLRGWNEITVVPLYLCSDMFAPTGDLPCPSLPAIGSSSIPLHLK